MVYKTLLICYQYLLYITHYYDKMFVNDFITPGMWVVCSFQLNVMVS
eukprot:UN00881